MNRVLLIFFCLHGLTWAATNPEELAQPKDEPAFVAGTVVDNRGKPLSIHECRWYGLKSGGTGRAEEGRWRVEDLPPGPILLEFTLKGYRAALLESGRNFEKGDTDVRVVLPKGPYREFESVFLAVTERPVSERDEVYQGDLIWSRLPEYRKLAGNVDCIWLVVTAPDGKPVTRIDVSESEPHLRIIPDTVQAATARPRDILTSRNGRYRLRKNRVFVSAPGYGRIWVEVPDPGQRAEPNYFSLYPASVATVTVQSQQGSSQAGVRVTAEKLAEGWPQVIDPGPPGQAFPVTNLSGQVTFAELSPGMYRFVAYGVEQDAYVDTSVRVLPGKSYDIKLSF